MKEATRKQKAEALIKWFETNPIPVGLEFVPAQRIFGPEKFLQANTDILKNQPEGSRSWILAYYRLYYTKQKMETKA